MLASITYKTSNQQKVTMIDPALNTFYLNSGASVHISNVKSDFYALCPTTPHAVNGVSGSSILAVRIGSIRLTVTKGLHITLHDIQFIPTVMVCLLGALHPDMLLCTLQ